MSLSVTKGETKFLAIVSITVLFFVAVVAGSVVALAAGHKGDDVPYLHVANGSKLIRVEPLVYCTIDLATCEGSPSEGPTRIPVKVGDTVMVSLSSDLSVGPWTLVVQYLTGDTKDGFENTAEKFYSSDSKRTITLASTRDRILAAIEIKQPSQKEVNGDFAPRGIWGIDTLPDGVEVPVTDQE
jgi:hypothetical protein